jgi:hypothetical protein
MPRFGGAFLVAGIAMWRRRAPVTDDRLGHGTTAVRMPVATDDELKAAQQRCSFPFDVFVRVEMERREQRQCGPRRFAGRLKGRVES